MGGWNKQIGDGIIVAAGAAQPDAVPSPEDFAGCRREEQKARDRHTVGLDARLIVVEDPAAADDPSGMLATAPEWPPAASAVAAIHGDCFQCRRKCAAGDHKRVAAVNFTRCARREIPAEHAVFAA